MENVTKLRRTKNTIEQEKSEKVIEKFIEACINVNASIFEPFIEEDQLFEDVDKYRFLQLMKDQFDHCLGYGMEKLTLRKGVCKGCQNGKKTYEFYHEDYMAFSYVIIIEEEELTDIFQCSFSSGIFDSASFPF